MSYLQAVSRTRLVMLLAIGRAVAVLGLLTALGLAGVVLILHDRPMGGEAGWGWLASAISLVSITLGTLYQRRYCSAIDWRSDCSNRGPSRNPSTSGASGISRRRMT